MLEELVEIYEAHGHFTAGDEESSFDCGLEDEFGVLLPLDFD